MSIKSTELTSAMYIAGLHGADNEILWNVDMINLANGEARPAKL